MKLKKLSVQQWIPLLVGILLILGSFVYLESSRRGSRGSAIVFDKPQAPAVSGSEPTKVAIQQARRAQGVKQTPRTKLLDLLEMHKGEGFLAARGVGIPFDPADSTNKSWRDFWKFVSEVKEQLGPEAFATLKSFMADSESSAYKDFFVAVMVALKDPEVEPFLLSIINNKEAPFSQRTMAIYGLGQLGTDSAWASFQEVWKEINKADFDKNILRESRRAGFLAMSSFGKIGAAFLLREVEALIKAGNTGTAATFLGYVRFADADELQSLAKTSKSPAIRDAALRAMAGDLKTYATMGAMLDLLLTDRNPEMRKAAAQHLATAIRLDKANLNASPEALERLVTNFNTLPQDLQLALYKDPAARKLIPIPLEQFAANSTIKSSPNYIMNIGEIYASDPASHAMLKDLILTNWKQGALSGAYIGFVIQGKEYSDPQLSAALAKMVNDPEFKALQKELWMVLGKGPAEPRREALREAASSYWTLPGESDRFAMIGKLTGVGSDARPVLMNLIKQESAPLPRIEMAYELISAAQGSDKDLAEIKSVISADLSQVLSGQSDWGIQYISMHPGGIMTGLTRFAALARNYYSAYGTSAQIAEIRSFADRLYIPDNMVGNDVLSATFIRNEIRESMLQSIDEIKRREHTE